MRLSSIRPHFVEFIPRELEDGILYISDRFATASHKCACGCGERVVTPLSPADWQLRKDGNLVSLYPSIGNWKYACRSHYWIRRNQIHWARAFTASEIAEVERRDAAAKSRYIAQVNKAKGFDTDHEADTRASGEGFLSWLARLLNNIFRGR